MSFISTYAESKHLLNYASLFFIVFAISMMSLRPITGKIYDRLVRTEDGRGRRAAVEIMLNTPLMSDLILKGNFHELKEVMSKSRELGMQTFDQALFDLYNQGAIAYEEALRNADSVNELRLQIKLKSSRANPQLNSNSALSFDQAVAEKAKDAEEEKDDA
jgi:twitching motility protein PilU